MGSMRSNSCTLAAVLIGVVCMTMAEAVRAGDALHFGASPAGASWRFSRTDTACELAQPIPDFGVARFRRTLDQTLAFELVPLEPVLARAPVDVAIFAPPWLPGAPPRQALATVETTGALVRMVGAAAEDALSAMYVGRATEVRQDASHVVVDVSPVNFRASYERFGDCAADLRVARFAAYERSSIPFAANEEALDASARARCAAIARYVREDPSVARVFVDGHTDASGDPKKNVALSKHRADIVARELVAAGVPADKIVVRYHAARYPIDSNDNEKGREKNRRTTIRLARDDAIANR